MKQLTKWLINAIVIQLLCVSPILSNNNNIIEIEYQSADGAYVLYWDCSYSTTSPTLYINITSVTGGSGNYTINAANDTYVSQTNVKEGEGFTFYFTEVAQNADNVSFTITDTQNNTCDIDFYIETQLYFLDIGNCSEINYYCKENITHHQGMVPVAGHSASNSIFSAGTIQSTTDIEYYAGGLIDLKPGFEVKTNADFLAEIQICP